MTDVLRTSNPADPSEAVAEVAAISPRAVDRWLTRSGGVLGEWQSSASHRATSLHAWAQRVEENADALASLVCREVGKPITEARAEVVRTVAIIRFYAQAAYEPIGEELPASDSTSRLTVERHPRGTVLAVTPWNFPLAIPAWKLAPALAFGNAAALKPASAAIGAAQRLTELARPDIPEEVLALFAMRGAMVMDLIGDRRIHAVSFTGSAQIGRSVVSAAAAAGVAVQAEMGGSNPAIVLEDVDLESAAPIIASAAMAYAGQKCTATSRLILLRDLADTAVDSISAEVERLAVGDPRDPSTTVGPLISEEARSEVASAVRSALGRGASLLTGGSERGPGWAYIPTLLRVTSPMDDFAQTEVFGPAVAVIVVNDETDAIQVANATQFGLAAAVYGRDLQRAEAVARSLRAGMIRVNAPTTGVDFHAPFGGEAGSSYGPREQGRAAREFYTSTRTVLVRS